MAGGVVAHEFDQERKQRGWRDVTKLLLEQSQVLGALAFEGEESSCRVEDVAIYAG